MDSIDRIVAVSATIPGWTETEDARQVALASFALPEGATVVEVGVYMGRCTVLLAGARRLRGSGTVHCVDPFDCSGDQFSVPYYVGGLRTTGLDSLERAFRKNIAGCDLDQWVAIHRGTALEVAAGWSKPIDLLLLDADQSPAGARAAYEAWSPFLRRGGTLIVRNTADREYAEGHDGYRRLVLEEIHPPRYRDIRVGETTFAIKDSDARSGIDVKLFVCIFDDASLLPHFLRHYDRAGITEFHIAAPPDLAEQIAAVSAGHNVFQYNDFNVAESVTGGVSAVAAMRERAQGIDEWVVIVDLDEFVEFGAPLSEVIASMDAEGANVGRGIMYDRFTVDGRPQPFDDGSDLPSLFPVRARLIRNVMGGTDVKGILVKGHLSSRPGAGHHFFEDEVVYSQDFEISHYKWNDPSLKRMQQAYEMSRAAGREWAEEYKRVLDHYATHGRFAWETFGGELAEPARRLVELERSVAALSAELETIKGRRVVRLADRILSPGSWRRRAYERLIGRKTKRQAQNPG
jgi:hypothetical protein